MRYREKTEDSQMVGEALLDYAAPDNFVTEEYLENECFTLEESRARLKRVIFPCSEKRQVAEEFARKISLTTDDYKDLENQNFCMNEKPQTLRFSSIEDEIAYYDSLDEEEDFLSEEDSAKYMELWKSV